MGNALLGISHGASREGQYDLQIAIYVIVLKYRTLRSIIGFAYVCKPSYIYDELNLVSVYLYEHRLKNGKYDHGSFTGSHP